MNMTYETLLLLSPELGSEGSKEVVDTLTGIIDRDGGQSITIDDWGIKELAYPVRKQVRGQYIRMEYTLPGDKVNELERNIRNADGIFKFLTVKLDPKAKAKAEQKTESKES
ncbi:30S ribosomal protein S6 [Desulfonatronovibrio magnus]|uniref:30S ribosomal protein S6 n=1 Tax=Desulfonatronovibrio magnus TaxID=698827 RepID=UPI0005EB07B0|nr:30S ribosomal protein S6 [Desulfonatronovibrio magnus]